MGNDLSSYRVRISTFSPRNRLKSKPLSCCSYVLTLFCYPRASPVLAIYIATSLLICSGDVELNPGPGKLDAILAKLDAFDSQNTEFQNETREKLSVIASKIDSIAQRVSVLEVAATGYDKIITSVQEFSFQVNNLQATVPIPFWLPR